MCNYMRCAIIEHEIAFPEQRKSCIDCCIHELLAQGDNLASASVAVMRPRHNYFCNDFDNPIRLLLYKVYPLHLGAYLYFVVCKPYITHEKPREEVKFANKIKLSQSKIR